MPSKRTRDLDEILSVADLDIMEISQDQGADYKSTKITFANFKSSMSSVFEAADPAIQTHITQTTGNPHNLDSSDTGSEPANANIQSHISTTSGNPHSVDHSELGNRGSDTDYNHLTDDQLEAIAPDDGSIPSADSLHKHQTNVTSHVGDGIQSDVQMGGSDDTSYATSTHAGFGIDNFGREIILYTAQTSWTIDSYKAYMGYRSVGDVGSFTIDNNERVLSFIPDTHSPHQFYSGVKDSMVVECLSKDLDATGLDRGKTYFIIHHGNFDPDFWDTSLGGNKLFDITGFGTTIGGGVGYENSYAYYINPTILGTEEGDGRIILLRNINHGAGHRYELFVFTESNFIAEKADISPSNSNLINLIQDSGSDPIIFDIRDSSYYPGEGWMDAHTNAPGTGLDQAPNNSHAHDVSITYHNKRETLALVCGSRLDATYNGGDFNSGSVQFTNSYDLTIDDLVNGNSSWDPLVQAAIAPGAGNFDYWNMGDSPGTAPINGSVPGAIGTLGYDGLYYYYDHSEDVIIPAHQTVGPTLTLKLTTWSTDWPLDNSIPEVGSTIYNANPIYDYSNGYWDTRINISGSWTYFLPLIGPWGQGFDRSRSVGFFKITDISDPRYGQNIFYTMNEAESRFYTSILKDDSEWGTLLPYETTKFEGVDDSGGSDNAILTDSTASWDTDRWVDYEITNVTTGISGTIVSNDATTITTSGLSSSSGFAGLLWSDGDSYEIHGKNVMNIEPFSTIDLYTWRNSIITKDPSVTDWTIDQLYGRALQDGFRFCMNAPRSEYGKHNGAANQPALTDSNRNWVPDQWVGYTITNDTDGSSGTVTSNTTTTITATLSGGTDNDWDVDDEYSMVGDDTQGSTYLVVPGKTLVKLVAKSIEHPELGTPYRVPNFHFEDTGVTVPDIVYADFDPFSHFERGPYTGNHLGATSATVLTTTQYFWEDFVNGSTVTNVTDGSSGTITASDGYSITATLTGGSDNQWETGDEYSIQGSTKANHYLWATSGLGDTIDYGDGGYQAPIGIVYDEILNAFYAWGYDTTTDDPDDSQHIFPKLYMYRLGSYGGDPVVDTSWVKADYRR